VPTTPVWSAPHNGIIGDASAIAGAGQINQLLGTHPDSIIYQGARILLPEYTYSPQANPWNMPLSTRDVDQPFTLTGSNVGRIQLPILPVGAGADLLVSLCSDNSGHPGAAIAQTRIPQAWINNLAAVSAPATPAGTYPATELTGNALAVAQFQIWSFADQTILPYNYPAITFVGVSAEPSTTWYGGYIIIIGGVSNDVALSGVYTMPYTAGGTLAPTVPQPAFPAGNDGSSASCVAIDAVTASPIVVNTGGGTAFAGAPVANVYTASLNTTTGQMSTWAAQTALPAAVQSHVMATWDGYVYSIGGKNTGGMLSAVNVAQVQNGQITAWSATTPLPVALQLMFAVACNGFLIVAGGADASFTAQSATWYASIGSNGSLGPWIPGPALHSGAYDLNANPFANNQGVIMTVGVNTLTVGESGLSTTWNQDTVGGSGALPGYWDFGNGQVLEYALAPSGNEYGTAYFNLLPYLSVPLPTVGLSSGSTYHLLLQQVGGSAGSYLCTAVTSDTYSASGPTALTSLPGAYAWTAQSTGSAVPIQVYDQSVAGPALHTWQDNGARITTLVSATTPDQRLLGICDATVQSTALNANAGFESATTPWTVSGGTLARSSTQVYEGGAAARVTPSGSASSVYLASEIMPCMPGQWVTAAGWMWFTSAVTTNASMSIAWYTAVTGGTSISTSSSPVSVTAATWTQLAQSVQAPAGAYGCQIQATLSGTPASSQVWYLDAVRASYTYTGPQVSTVSQVEYAGAWPTTGAPAPTGVTQLA
jgi:hypothetical protein